MGAVWNEVLVLLGYLYGLKAAPRAGQSKEKVLQI